MKHIFGKKRKPVRELKLSLKKTCNGCSALAFTHGGFQEKCDLGFPQKWHPTKERPHPYPLVPCKKPLTNREWLTCEDYEDIISKPEVLTAYAEKEEVK